MSLIAADMKEGDLHPISIDYQLYTDGDISFKRKLLSLMIDNLQELMEASKSGSEQILHKAIHKARPTLLILEDELFNQAIKEVSELNSNQRQEAEQIRLRNEFRIFCNKIINSLHREIEMI